MQNGKPKQTTVTGLEEKWEVFVVYLVGILGFIFSFMKYDYLSENIKFHYHQAGTIWLVNIIFIIVKVILAYTINIGIISYLFNILSFVLWIFAIITIVKAFSNEKYEIPVIADLSKKIFK